MTIIEIENTIKLLREKKKFALENMMHYKNGRTDIDNKLYQEYMTLSANFIFEIAKQKPMYSTSYRDAMSGILRRTNLDKIDGIINAIEEEIKLGTIIEQNENKKKNDDIGHIIENIFDNFHSCCRQARNRYKNRPTIDVKDEYDVQGFITFTFKNSFF